MIDRVGSVKANVYYFPQPKQEPESSQLVEQRTEESRQLAIKATQADHVKRVESALNAWMNFEAGSNAPSGAATAHVHSAYEAV